MPIRLICTIVSKGRSGCGPLRAGHLLRPAGARAADRDPQAAVGLRRGLHRRLHLVLLADVAGREPGPELVGHAPGRVSALTSAIVTSAPAPASRRAVASPSPEAPPTTSAPLPSIRMAAILRGGAISTAGRLYAAW